MGDLLLGGYASAGADADVKANASLQQAVQASTDFVCMAGPSVVADFLVKLESAGAIALEGLPGDEILPLEQEQQDAEVDLSDEDVFDGIPRDQTDGRDVDAFQTEDVYAIDADVLCKGDVEESVPEIGGAAYVGRNSLGRAALDKLSKRQKTYLEIARWLHENDGGHLETPAALRAGHRLETQKNFLRRSGMKGIDDALLSRYLQGACLAWSEGSLPLRSLFK